MTGDTHFEGESSSDANNFEGQFWSKVRHSDIIQAICYMDGHLVKTMINDMAVCFEYWHHYSAQNARLC